MTSLNVIDRLVAAFNPIAGMRRLQARQAMAFYEAAKPSRQRKLTRGNVSPNRAVQSGAESIREQMRHYDRNYDLVAGALDTMVNNIVGPRGLGVEFQPRRADGTIHQEYASLLASLYEDWKRRPEVTWSHDFEHVCRLLCRTWLREGEAFAQRLIGPVNFLDHGTKVPYSVELLEPDMVPMSYNDPANGVVQGVQLDAWGRKRNYYVFKAFPGDMVGFSALSVSGLKSIPADRMLQVAHLTRIGQLRGVSRFASVITRIEDLKDYEESERIAAKVAAMMTAYVKRQAPDGGGYEGPMQDEDGNVIQRQISLSPGAIIDTLAVGEEIGMIDSNRPNPNLVTWRGGQLRAFAAGISASYSSLARDYNGTYSAQRQELVECWCNYAALTDDFVGRAITPMVDDFTLAARLSGLAKPPKDVKPGTEGAFLAVAPAMPWINPLHEAAALLELTQAGFMSEIEAIRRRGANPDEVMAQIFQFREQARAKGLLFTSDAASAAAAKAQAQPQQDFTKGTP
ncbi:phage portal protein [Paucibacter sp. APW11]|uniref:Phage portal protein n=1 Tax=Roseateles aquae TaxID=3077235 RepID=A0ABU3P7Z0_9BURK|nr:phage portal protein [Paucibacter sp. APW11]MDT8998340.1 phage portal protein [Paucibacter sp. APW11]